MSGRTRPGMRVASASALGVVSVLAVLFTVVLGGGLARADVRGDATAAIGAFAADSGNAALLGGPTGTLRMVRGGGGASQTFERGTVYYSPDTGAQAVYGAIAARYRAVGGPAAIGYPTGGEQAAGDGRFSEFNGPEGAAIYWSPTTRASLLTGGVLRAWRASGGVTGPFGFPTSDTVNTGRADEADFAGPAGTHIAWSSTTGLETTPAELLASMPTMAVAADSTETISAAKPAPPAPAARSGWRKWWPWAVAAACVLVLLIALVVLFRRGRGSRKPDDDAAPAPTAAGTPAAVASPGSEAVVPAAGAAAADEPVAEPEPEPEPEPEEPPEPVLSEETALASSLVVTYAEDVDHGPRIAYENNALGADHAGGEDATRAWLHGAGAAETGGEG